MHPLTLRVDRCCTSRLKPPRLKRTGGMLVLPVLGVVASLVKRLAPERVRHPAAPKKAQTLFAARAGDGMHRQAQGRPRMFHAPSHAARGAGRPISASIQKRTAIAAANCRCQLESPGSAQHTVVLPADLMGSSAPIGSVSLVHLQGPA